MDRKSGKRLLVRLRMSRRNCSAKSRSKKLPGSAKRSSPIWKPRSASRQRLRLTRLTGSARLKKLKLLVRGGHPRPKQLQHRHQHQLHRNQRLIIMRLG